MEYTVQQLAKLAGVTSRTLRYYDEIGLLKPARVNASGYRIYGAKEVDQLQQILFYRELGVDLETIKQIIMAPSFDDVQALKQHREKLLAERRRLEALIANVEKTLLAKEGRIIMSDKEKFEAFKQQLIDENERNYGKEIREKYGEEQVNKANEKVKNMTQAQYEEVTKLGEEVLRVLYEAFLTGDPAGELAQKAADLHRQWLSYFGTIIQKKRMQDWRKCTLTTNDLKHTTIKNNREWQSFSVMPSSFIPEKIGRQQPVFLHCKSLRKDVYLSENDNQI